MNPDGQVYFDNANAVPPEDIERLKEALSNARREAFETTGEDPTVTVAIRRSVAEDILKKFTTVFGFGKITPTTEQVEFAKSLKEALEDG